MKRQERLLLFFEREARMLNEVLAEHPGYAGLYFSSHTFPLLTTARLKFLFKAASHEIPDADAVFNTEELPLPSDFFDVVVLDHLLDTALSFEVLLKEALRVSRKQGSVIITGFNKSRLCSWPIQNTFGKTLSCPIKRYSALNILGLLDQLGFCTEVRYYDFCSSAFWNKILSKVVPFLGIGFIIIAKRRTIDLIPLEELNWNFAAVKPVTTPAQPECRERNGF